MFQAQIGEDERIRRKAKARAQRDRLRLERLKNPKLWKQTYDLKELGEQVEGKKMRAQRERTERLQSDRVMVDQAGASLEEDAEKIKRARLERVEVMKDNLKFDVTKTTTFDINDPNFLKNTQPPRCESNQAVPVSSLQGFDGEDLGYKNRVQNQKQTANKLFREQMREREEKKRAEKNADRNFAQNQTQLVKEMTKLELEKNSRAKNGRYENKRENVKLAEEFQYTQYLSKEIEKMEKEKEIEFNRNQSKLLLENYSDTKRCGQENRYIPYNFKGFTVEQQREFFEQRLQQAEEHKIAKMETKNIEMQHHNISEAQRKVALKLENKKRKEKLQQRTEYSRYIQEQAEENRKMKKERNAILTNKITDDFFSQFGTSCR